jgi:hypothetical protein
LKESIYDRMTNAEKEVAHMLKELGIQWSYERPLFIWDEYNRPRVWTPDFFLTQFGIYLEVCGTVKFDYSYRKMIFNRNGYHVIFLHLFSESIRWKNHFIFYLRLFTGQRNHNLNEILRKTSTHQ